MNAFHTMLDRAPDVDGMQASPYRGWRLAVNRVMWRGFIFTVGTLVIWAEKVFPGRGYGLRLFASTARVTNRLLGVRVEVIERSTLVPGQAYVFTPNHRSHIDITAVASALPGARFAAKRELFTEPILGAAMRALGMIPIDREDPAAARRALDDAAAKFGRQVSLVIFPEGTRAPARCMLPFKSGPFVFAIQAQVPIVPVALHNTAQVMPAHGYLSIPGGRIVVEFLDPISTAGLTLDDRHALKERVRTALLEALRPDDGGVAKRPDLGSFAGHAYGVRTAPVVPRGDGAIGAHPPVTSAGNAADPATPALKPAAAGHDPPGRAA